MAADIISDFSSVRTFIQKAFGTICDAVDEPSNLLKVSWKTLTFYIVRVTMHILVRTCLPIDLLIGVSHTDEHAFSMVVAIFRSEYILAG